jgi:hypothetical protein
MENVIVPIVPSYVKLGFSPSAYLCTSTVQVSDKSNNPTMSLHELHACRSKVVLKEKQLMFSKSAGRETALHLLQK